MPPERIPVVCAVVSILLVLAAIATRFSGRFGVPSLLSFLALGVVARAQTFLPLPDPSADFSFDIGTLALVFILFDGGLNISLAAARSVAAPATVLAVVGTVLTATLVAAAGRLTGLSTPIAILLGAAVSSTDAAAVFTLLRGGGTRLRERVGLTLELESTLNDPVAVILTIAATDLLLGHHDSGFELTSRFLQQVAGGIGVGLGVGYAGRVLLEHASLPAWGVYPVLSVALALGAFGTASLLGGSGFLAVVLAAIVLSSGRLPYRAGILRVHDSLAWLAQIAMFLILGLSITPAELAAQAGRGAVLAIFLALIARPLAVFASLAPFHYPWRERLYIAITGLRGAVPIVLATYPITRAVPGASALFDLVFVMVGFNSLVPGALATPVAKLLGIRKHAAPRPPAGIEVVSQADFDGDFVSYFISGASAAAGATVQELPLPESCLVTLIVRGRSVVAPRGGTRIDAGDHVYVFATRADRALMDLLFGSAD